MVIIFSLCFYVCVVNWQWSAGMHLVSRHRNLMNLRGFFFSVSQTTTPLLRHFRHTCCYYYYDYYYFAWRDNVVTPQQAVCFGQSWTGNVFTGTAIVVTLSRRCWPPPPLQSSPPLSRWRYCRRRFTAEFTHRRTSCRLGRPSCLDKLLKYHGTSGRQRHTSSQPQRVNIANSRPRGTIEDGTKSPD